MVKSRTLFKYKIIKGPLHKLPVMLKLFILIFIPVFCFKLTSLWLGIVILLTVIFALFCKFTTGEQLTDIKPALFYAAIMYFLSILSNLTETLHNINISIFIPNPDYLNTALRLTYIIQLSALFFRTTSFMEIKDCLNIIERFIKQLFKIPLKTYFTDTISLFLIFIPEFFIVWSNINLAWKARGGKPGIKKIKTLVFILITICFEKAALKARALEARKIY